MASTEFIVQIIKGKIVQEKHKQQTLDGIELYNKIFEKYQNKKINTKESLSLDSITKKSRDALIDEILLKEGYLYNVDKYTRNFICNIPGASIRAVLLDKKDEGEPEDFFAHTVFTYKINIIINYWED